MISVWPVYVREMIALAGAKNVTKSVNVIANMKKPLTNDYLIKDAELKLESGKKIVLVRCFSRAARALVVQPRSRSFRLVLRPGR